MTEWQPLSVRRGLREAREPQEGIPEHLHRPLDEWFSGVFQKLDGYQAAEVARSLALLFDMVPGRYSYQSVLASTITDDPDTFLDIADTLLHSRVALDSAAQLEEILKLGGSVWTLTDELDGLTERVPEAESQTYQAAVAASDSAAEHLKEAWNRAYGMNRDPDDAWDHAIKACEAMYIPIVTPNNAKANLGSVIGQLDGQPELWDFRLVHYPSRDTALPALVQMLRVIWVDPNRHAGQPGSQPATQEEAENVVSLAVTLVSWARTGVLRRYP